MRKSIISLALALGLALPAFSDTLTLRPDAPARYTVVKGDTLWGIAGHYLNSPWKWPRLWQMNKNEVKNPHWIYPGDVLVLTYVNGVPKLALLQNNGQDEVKLSPQVRMEDINQAIYSIPAKAIEPFLRRPLVVNAEEFSHSPRLIAGPEQRIAFGPGDRVYANGISETGTWQAYQLGKELIDPDTQENLGFEVNYGGDMVVDKLGSDVQSLRVTSVAGEVQAGDHLIKSPKDLFTSYVPHAADSKLQGKIISIYDGVAGAAQFSNVVINRGSREGVEPGNVFAVFKKAKLIPIETTSGEKKEVLLPGESVGKIFVYRVFDKVSYGLVMESADTTDVGDVVGSPDLE